jgi:predicted RNase H-like HicB family nuclease
MSETRKKSSGVHRKIDRPFERQVLTRAERIAAEYQILMWQEDGEYYGRGLEMPHVIGDGPTPDQCMRNTRNILKTAVAVMLEDGQAPPIPARPSAEHRSQRITLRFSREEKLRLELLARERGFVGVADYLRACALAG